MAICGLFFLLGFVFSVSANRGVVSKAWSARPVENVPAVVGGPTRGPSGPRSLIYQRSLGRSEGTFPDPQQFKFPSPSAKSTGKPIEFSREKGNVRGRRNLDPTEQLSKGNRAGFALFSAPGRASNQAKGNTPTQRSEGRRGSRSSTTPGAFPDEKRGIPAGSSPRSTPEAIQQGNNWALIAQPQTLQAHDHQ